MSELAETIYRSLINDPARLRMLHRLQYRCDRGDRCLLLDAIEVPGPERVLIHQNRFKYSDDVNLRRSSAAGRAKNTLDGDNHWASRTYFIGSSALDLDDELRASLAIQCDHVGVRRDGAEVLLRPMDFRADWEAGHAEVVVRADGSRYAR